GQKSGPIDHTVPSGIGCRRQGRWFFGARRFGREDPLARIGRCSCRTDDAGTTIIGIVIHNTGSLIMPLLQLSGETIPMLAPLARWRTDHFFERPAERGL